jgi:stalled ribosome alternative rescue factor ArfA
MPRRLKPRNLAAKALRTPMCRPRVVKTRKGKGSYTRKARKEPPADA